jgi:hypothetical protein
MAARMMDELAPLLAAEGIDLDDLDDGTGLGEVNAALPPGPCTAPPAHPCPGPRSSREPLPLPPGRPGPRRSCWAGGVIAAVLGLGWMAAQIPRKAAAPAYGLHGGGNGGRTLCDPSVLASAVQDQVECQGAALLGGTADEPDLTLEVTVNDRADVQDVLVRLEASVLTDLSTALEAPLRRCRVLIEATGRPQGGAVARSTGTVLQ